MSMPNSDEHGFERLVDLAGAPNREPSGGLDPDTARRVGTLRRVMDSIRAVGGLNDAAIQRATALPGTLAERLGLDRVAAQVAQLVGDSRNAVLAGYRGTTTLYSLTFECDGAEVHIEVTPPGEHAGVARLHGQVDDAGSEARGRVGFRRVLDSVQVATATLDEGGYFDLAIELGTYDLVLETEARTVIVPAVEIG